jgi:hypothetical protein
VKHATPATVSLVNGQDGGRKTGERQPDGMLMLFFMAFGLADPLH